MKKLRFGIKGMSCAACVAHVEHAAAKVLSKEEISVSLLTNSMTVTVEDGVNEKELFEALGRSLSSAGYGLVSEEEKKKRDPKVETKRDLRRLILSSILTLLLMYVAMGGMLGLPIPRILTENGVLFGLSQLILTVPVILLNFRFYRNGFFALFHGSPNMDSLIAIGSSASLAYGLVAIGMMIYGTYTGDHSLVHEYMHTLYFESAAMILTLVSLGKTLEGRAKAGVEEAIRRLSSMMPKEARIEREGETLIIPSSDVQPGDVILVREGEIIPVDGVIIEGSASVDESSMSGESIPVEKGIGDRVLSICVVRSGYIKLSAEKVGEDTSLSRMIALLEDAASSKAKISRLADRISGIFVPVVITISLITALLWVLLTQDIPRAFSCAVSVLVISCPCALGLATPTAVTVGISKGAERGILIKSSHALEQLGRIRYFLTDKTGTLTEGAPKVTDLFPWGDHTEEELIGLSYGVEALSTHPLASAICEEGRRRNISIPTATDYESTAGRGISGTIDGKKCLVGTEDYLKAFGISIEDSHRSRLESEGKTTVSVAYDGSYVGVIGIADPLREDSARAIQRLKKMGITPVLITGDHPIVAKAIAKECGISEEHIHAKALPEDKERILRGYSQKGSVAMVGDGINDAPALSAAEVGIAIGAGTEVAIDCADVILSRNSLIDAVRAIDLSRATLRCIKENLFWALIYNVVCIPIAAGVLYPGFGIALSPMIGSAAMSVSSVCVVLNSLRLRRVSLFEEGKVNKNKQNPIQNQRKKEQEEMFGKTKTVTFGVEGMMCKNCKAHVEKALSETKGVKSAVADLESKTVTVVAKDSVSEDTLKAAVIAAGYQVK